MSLPKGKRIPGNRKSYDAILEQQAYDDNFYQAARKDFSTALPHLRQWFVDNFHDASSIIDLGCGSGEMIACIKDDFDVYGVDFSIGAQKLAPAYLGDHFFIGDLTQPLKSQISNLKTHYDVVVSLETYEHIHAEYETTYLNNIASFDPDHIVISCALNEQKGRHHYNTKSFFDFITTVENHFPHMQGNFRATRTLMSLPKLRYFYRYNTIVMSRSCDQSRDIA